LNVNSNEVDNLNETKICKRLIKKFLDKINFKLPILVYFVDIENIYNEYMKDSSFNSIEDRFEFNEKTKIPNNVKNDIRETENLYNYYCKDFFLNFFSFVAFSFMLIIIYKSININTFIVGKSGAGKSTFINLIFEKAYRNKSSMINKENKRENN